MYYLLTEKISGEGKDSQMCVICGDAANGVHFGAMTCEGCKVTLAFLLHVD